MDETVTKRRERIARQIERNMIAALKIKRTRCPFSTHSFSAEMTIKKATIVRTMNVKTHGLARKSGVIGIISVTTALTGECIKLKS